MGTGGTRGWERRLRSGRDRRHTPEARACHRGRGGGDRGRQSRGESTRAAVAAVAVATAVKYAVAAAVAIAATAATAAVDTVWQRQRVGGHLECRL